MNCPKQIYFKEYSNNKLYIKCPEWCIFEENIYSGKGKGKGKNNGVCDGRCYHLGRNHKNKPYCLNIMCMCDKNHPLNWHSVPSFVDLNNLNYGDYAFGICKYYETSIIQQMISDNLNIESSSTAYGLYKSLEKRLKINLEIEYVNSTIDEINSIKENERRTKMNEIKKHLNKYTKMDESQLLKVRLGFYIDITNRYNYYITTIKQQFLNMNMTRVLTIVDEFLEPEDKILTQLKYNEYNSL